MKSYSAVLLVCISFTRYSFTAYRCFVTAYTAPIHAAIIASIAGNESWKRYQNVQMTHAIVEQDTRHRDDVDIWFRPLIEKAGIDPHTINIRVFSGNSFYGSEQPMTSGNTILFPTQWPYKWSLIGKTPPALITQNRRFFLLHELCHAADNGGHELQKTIAIPLSFAIAFGAGKAMRRILPRALRTWRPRSCAGSLVALGSAISAQYLGARSFQWGIELAHEYQADLFAIEHAENALQIATAAAYFGHLQEFTIWHLRYKGVPPLMRKDAYDTLSPALKLCAITVRRLWEDPSHPPVYFRYLLLCNAAQERLDLEKRDPNQFTVSADQLLTQIKPIAQCHTTHQPYATLEPQALRELEKILR